MGWLLCLECWNGRAKALHERKAGETNGVALSVYQLECLDEELTESLWVKIKESAATGVIISGELLQATWPERLTQ